jgi:valyl-tRNA synthetase
LDTWFSSALWPFSTMGWPDEDAEDFKRYFPTSTLVTGYDIIFFWVSRMIFQSLEFTDHRPFENVLIHGLIRDEQGRKMSKSLGNGIDPMDVVEKYGADALRWFLANGSAPGQDVRFSYEKMDAAWNFNNKIWNASRYVLMNLGDLEYKDIAITGEKTTADKWILSNLNKTIAKVTDLFEKFEFGEAGRLLYHFIWDDYCDWYIEMTKEVLQGDDEEAKRTTRSILAHVLDNVLRLLHPIMPFMTEEIWQNVPHEGSSLVVAAYPTADAAYFDEAAEEAMDKLIELIRSVRNVRSEMNTPLSKKVNMQIKVNDAETETIFNENKSYIIRFCNPETLEISQTIEPASDAVTAIIAGGEVYMPLAGLIKLEDEIARLEKEAEKLNKEVQRVEGKLKNEKFISKAPQDVVDGERQKEAEYREKLAAVEERIASLKEQLA